MVTFCLLLFVYNDCKRSGRMQKILTIVVPCFNEEKVLPETVKELGGVLNNLIVSGQVAAKSKLLFVNDGSKDQTWALISRYTKQYSYVTGIKFSRNFGQQNALMAGMSLAVKYSDLIITIDADLQDDVNAIPKMIKKYEAGYDVVYGVRNNRQTDTFFKRRTALALSGITSFSSAPLHLIMDLGLLIVILGIIWLFCTIFNKGLGQVARSWTSLMISIWLIGGIQLVALGVIGEYVDKTNIEVKRRPRFIIEQATYTKKMK